MKYRIHLHKWEDNVIALKEKGREGLGWIELALVTIVVVT